MALRWDNYCSAVDPKSTHRRRDKTECQITQMAAEMGVRIILAAAEDWTLKCSGSIRILEIP